MKPLSVAAAVVLCLPAAQCVAAAEEIELEEVLVTARRVLAPGLGAAVVDQTVIARQRARSSDTASLLAGIPGVGLSAAGGVSSLPVIRGLADDRLRTQVDGTDLPATCPNHMNPPLSYIDPTAVDRIEVYPGVTPVSVGGDSIGGSIVVRSRDPEFAGPGEGLANGEVGTFYRGNADGLGGNLAATFATERLSLSYSGAYAQSDNYSAGDAFKDYTFTGRAGHALPTDEVGSTAYQSSNQTLRAAWRGDGHLLELGYSHQDVPYEGFANQRMDLTGNRSDLLRFAYTGRLEWGTLQARASYQQTRHDMDFGDDKRFWYGPGAAPAGSGGDTATSGQPCTPISGSTMVGGQVVGCAAGMPMKSDGETIAVGVDAAVPLVTRGLLRIGAEAQLHSLDDWWPPSGAGMWPYDFLNVNDGQRDRLAAYGEWELTRSHWTHIVGLRFESVDMDAGPVHGYNTDMFPTSGSGGMGNQTRDAALFNAAARSRMDDNWDLSWLAQFTLSAHQSYEVGLAQKTRSPNLHERYAWSTWQMAAFMNNVVGDGNGYLGNLDLEPEVARTVSLGGRWHDAAAERWHVDLTPYFTDVSDYIDAIQWDATANAPRVVPVVGNFTVLRYANQSARLYGVDLAAGWVVADDTGLGRFETQLTASYTHGTNEDTDDALYDVMPLHARIALTQDLGAWHNAVEGEFVAARDEVSQVRNEMPTPGYGLVHLRSSYERDAWSVQVGIENLFDRYYELPLGGAYVGQGTTMTVAPPPNQPQWGRPVPGAGRSVYAGVNVRF